MDQAARLGEPFPPGLTVTGSRKSTVPPFDWGVRPNLRGSYYEEEGRIWGSEHTTRCLRNTGSDEATLIRIHRIPDAAHVHAHAHADPRPLVSEQKQRAVILLTCPCSQTSPPPSHRKAEEMAGPVLIRETKGRGGGLEGGGGCLCSVWKLEGQN